MTATAQASAALPAAPLYADVAEGPAGGYAVWLAASDGVQLRLGIWPEGTKGTILLIPGRTEYIEKYGRAAADLKVRGYATAVIDLRGQGLARRPHSDRMVGHVDDFGEYQRDIDAMLDAVQVLDLPRPYYLIGHSMGGCIALRALMRGLPVKAAVFSGPMWGINLMPWIKPFTGTIGALIGPFRQTYRYAPGTNGQCYLLTAPVVGNLLTTDAEMFAYMRRQVMAHPDLGLGGPSLGWVRAALEECGALSNLPAPDLPAITALGTAEKVVNTMPVHLRMAGWPKGRLDLYTGAEHEIIMEAPVHRTRFFDSAANLFAAHR